MVVKKEVNSFEIDELSDQYLLQIFEYMTPFELSKTVPLVCKRWRVLSYNSQLWRQVNFRPEFSGFTTNPDAVMALTNMRFGTQLKSIELSCELITTPIIHELANKCINLKYLTLDFSKATQLYDFSELVSFPSNLRQLSIHLSEVVFLEGFMRRVYSFLSPTATLHLIGTFEATSAEEEIFEVVNVSKIRAHTPNLTCINLFGVMFIDDSHIDMLATSCIHLEVIAVNYCLRITGSSFQHLVQRCKKIRTLLLRHIGIKDEFISAVDWTKCRYLSELDICMTDLSENTLLDLLTKIPELTYLGVSHCDFFSDKVLTTLLKAGKMSKIKSIDLSHTYSLTEGTITTLLKFYGRQVRGLMLNGKPKLSEQFWINVIKFIPNIKILVLGTAYGWFLGNISRVHIDQIVNYLALQCTNMERLEIQWEPDTTRYSDKSSKFIDLLRIKCGRLLSVTLADGGYYEMFRSNFDRAGRRRVVRPTHRYQTNIISLLDDYNRLLFN